ncbi:phage tail protein [Acidisphaera rubrifaciens]|uniref:phage tail protein n=1 Tax=Acidisphaera rubrifaciens TaxID=50715 RepID=UPI001F526917|nr:hypothetical protein [Acidisphaera rubrifaciens]
MTLTAAQLPAHTHAVNTSAKAGTTNAPSAGVSLATTGGTPVPLYAPPGTLQPMGPSAGGATGGGQPHDNMQPFVVLNYIIALVGVYPSQG